MLSLYNLETCVNLQSKMCIVHFWLTIIGLTWYVNYGSASVMFIPGFGLVRGFQLLVFQTKTCFLLSLP